VITVVNLSSAAASIPDAPLMPLFKLLCSTDETFSIIFSSLSSLLDFFVPLGHNLGLIPIDDAYSCSSVGSLLLQGGAELNATKMD
jgi:hypothetical protein